MVGVAYTLDVDGLDVAIARVAKIRALTRGRRMELADAIGAVLESSVRRRIADEKTAPDGTPWAEWSPAYAATRHAGHSLLRGEGDLMDSIQSIATPDAVTVGSNLVYAAIHQFGGEDVGMPIPARPYLGLSDADAADVADLAEDFLRRGLQ